MLTLVIDFDMAESNQLYYVKICVRSSVKLLEEIKLLLERNPNRERLFRRTGFERWLDILSHDNDNHLMHYVLLHQDSNSILELHATPSETKESWFIASINFINGLVDEDMNFSQDDGAGVIILLLESGDGVLDSEGGAKNRDTNKDKQPTMAEIFAEIHALRKEVALVKGDDERIAKLERLVNQIVVNQGKGGSSNDPMVLAGDGMPIDNVDGNHDIGIGLHNAVNQGLGGSSNDLMSLCSLADIDKGEVVGAGMGIDNFDGKNAYGKNEYTYSQRALSTLDVLIKALYYANDNLGIDVLQHDNDVDHFVAKLNQHPTADIHVEPIHNEEEHDAKYSLVEMNLIDEEEKLIVKDLTVKQHVDAFIDEHEDKTTVLQENVKASSFCDLHESNKSQYFNMVKDDYKPFLASGFSNVKPKRKKCGVERNYVLRSVEERKKRLAMSLDSPFGQQATTTIRNTKSIDHFQYR
ncbi:hypothetical protein Tco_1321076 [Tanacetum coccineum]